MVPWLGSLSDVRLRSAPPSGQGPCSTLNESALVVTESPAPTLALYRKHRPAAFDDLVGQSAVVDGLTAALRTGRTVHAYLFSGPRGTGKTSAARILAKCLNCERGGPRPDPCGKCASCVAISQGTSFDVIEIDAASNSRVEETRELLKGVDVVPAYSRMKVYIVDEIHMMSPSAFNALLKTLEEPPAHAVFILATTEPHKVPATILSRCQRYEFRRMAPETIGLRLKDVAAREKIRISADAITRLAFLADGALRDALVLLEQARGFAGDGAIDDAALDRAFGASHKETVSAIVDAIVAGDASAALEQVAAAAAAGIDPTWLTRELLRRFRLVLLAQHSPGTLAFETPPDDAKAVTALARRVEISRVYAALKYLSEALADKFSTQSRIDLELALVRIILPGEESGLREILERLRALESRSEGASGPSQSPPSGADAQPPRARQTARPAGASAAKTPASLSVAKLEGMWPMILSEIRASSNMLFGVLQHSTIADVAGTDVTLTAQNKFARDHASDPPMLKLIADAIAKHAGVEPNVRIVVGKSAMLAHAADPFAPASELDLI